MDAQITMLISIHPPLAGRDIKTKQEVLDGLFQSTRPLRGGTYTLCSARVTQLFQSTRPLRGGTSFGVISQPG